MELSRASNGRIFDLFAQPFRILGIDPTATNQQIEEAFRIAQQIGRASADALTKARDALLDPSQRLFYELSYPLDCPASEIEVFYAALSTDAPTEQLLRFTNLLWPLTRANFIADLASHRPADGATLLYALLESHAALDATEIYEKLKAARAAAGIPVPSFALVNQCLNELLHTHSSAAFAGYANIEDAAGPVLECTKQALAHGERHLVEGLGIMLAQYRQAIDPTHAFHQIENACIALQLQPDDGSLIEELSNAVTIWTSGCRPLLMWDTHQGRRELGAEAPIEQLRTLITNLSGSQHYDVAVKVMALTRDIFSAVPTTIDQLAEDARLIESLKVQQQIMHLQGAIDEFESNPGPLIAALQKDGFGYTSTEPAKMLWQAFLQAAKATNRTMSADLPWRLMRDFTLRLSNQPEAGAAVVGLITGLIQYGEKASAAPSILKALRDNLSFMKSFMDTEPTVETGHESQPLPGTRSFITRFFVRRSLPSNPKSIRGKSQMALAGLAFFTLAAVTASAYFGFDRLRPLWSTNSLGALVRPPSPTLGTETTPPVGTGQQLALDGVRYCHFQQERLRLIKGQVQGPEEARAYNLLIVDYNSRCSDFFYRDEDLKLVMAEVSENKNLLEADAKRIVSAWPSRSHEVSPKN